MNIFLRMRDTLTQVVTPTKTKLSLLTAMAALALYYYRQDLQSFVLNMLEPDPEPSMFETISQNVFDVFYQKPEPTFLEKMTDTLRTYLHDILSMSWYEMGVTASRSMWSSVISMPAGIYAAYGLRTNNRYLDLISNKCSALHHTIADSALGKKILPSWAIPTMPLHNDAQMFVASLSSLLKNEAQNHNVPNSEIILTPEQLNLLKAAHGKSIVFRDPQNRSRCLTLMAEKIVSTEQSRNTVPKK